MKFYHIKDIIIHLPIRQVSTPHSQNDFPVQQQYYVVLTSSTNYTMQKIAVLVIAVALIATASAVPCNMRQVGTEFLLGCAGTTVCADDTSVDTLGSNTNNLYCQTYPGGYSQCVPFSMVGAPGTYTYHPQSTSGNCRKGDLALYTGGTNSFGRFTCTGDAACSGDTSGRVRCVQHMPSQFGPGYKRCEV